ncbi:MAG TPA: hypothetical protein VMT15_03525 [Bryobacteraceae bacterium]|nr:hypothetical protein [Bryobacteraceae bacterium]
MTFFNTHKIAIGCIAFMAVAAAQTPPAAPKFKDDKEQTEAIAANTEKDPKAQLEKLDKWKADYPETEYAVQRTGLYFQVYGNLKMYHEQVQMAQELRKKVPNALANLDLLRTIFADVPQIKSPSAEDLAAITDAATYVIEHADDVFSAANKPANQTDAQWSALKPQLVAYAQVQLDWVAEQQGQEAAIARLKKDPTRVGINVWLGKQILAEAKAHPERQSDAIFHYARAAAYTGPGALPPNERATMKTFVDKAYKTYHGTMDGEDQLLATAASQALPDGFVIKSTVKMAEEAAAREEEIRGKDPMKAQWRDLKAILTGDGGDAKFQGEIKDSALPKFKGKIVSMTPVVRPKTIVLAVENEGLADCTITFETALPGKMEAGETLEFEGVAKAFTKEPYMLTLEVEKEKLTGWTGKNAPAARPAPKATTKKGE